MFLIQQEGMNFIWKTECFFYVIFWHLGDVFNLKGEYELHPKDRMSLHVIFWHLRDVKGYKFHPKDRMFLYVIFWHLGDEWVLAFLQLQRMFPKSAFRILWGTNFTTI